MKPRELFNQALSYTEEGCLIWPFSKNKNGYPQMGWQGQNKRVSRLVCELIYGPCPAGHETAHSCGNRSCINPKHLRWATHRDNCTDKIRHGTNPVGAHNGNAILTQEQVDYIRASYEGPKVLSLKFGVSQQQICGIQQGYAWKNRK